MPTRRNPRRAYEADGTMIAPPTVAFELEQGFATVMAFCEAQGCGHSRAVALDRFPPDLPVPDIALHLRCSQCGRKAIRIHLNVDELYARQWDGQGYGVTFGDSAVTDPIDALLALTPGESLTLTLDEIRTAFGEGEGGLVALIEIAEDNDCAPTITRRGIVISRR